ncbi:hypothetical protein BRDCF_p1507 [Bacteroidales bacterium CF]|nr:hypothetical protein BRDCF_p1507 [Bacteroidales bacterium CF]
MQSSVNLTLTKNCGKVMLPESSILPIFIPEFLSLNLPEFQI